MRDDGPLGVYVHVPFCRRRCGYCDFPVTTGRLGQVFDYQRAVGAEVAHFARICGPRVVDAIHFGGGTPSLVHPDVVARIVQAIGQALDVAEGAEIALEANPEDLSRDRLAEWRAAGVNRLALGVQSLEARGLQALGRRGAAPAEVRRVFLLAGEAGFASLGADFIFGWPGQTRADFARELKSIAGLPVAHLSLYALETDGKTALSLALARGARAAIDPDVVADMYELAVETLGGAGFERYEISNFARLGHQSRHNTKYWTDQPYVGLGPAACSYVDGARRSNPRRLTAHLGWASAGFDPFDWAPYDADLRAGEALVFGLRLARGLNLDRISSRHGRAPLDRRLPAIERAVERGGLVRAGACLRLAERSFFTANEVLVDLL